MKDKSKRFSVIPSFLINCVDPRTLRLFAWLRMTTPGHCHIDHLHKSGIKSRATIKKYVDKLIQHQLIGVDQDRHIFLRGAKRIAAGHRRRNPGKGVVVRLKNVKSHKAFVAVLTGYGVRAIGKKRESNITPHGYTDDAKRLYLPRTPRGCASVRFVALWLGVSKSTAHRRLTAARSARTIRQYETWVPLDLTDCHGNIAALPTCADLPILYERWPWLRGRIRTRGVWLRDREGRRRLVFTPFMRMPDRIKSLI